MRSVALSRAFSDPVSRSPALENEYTLDVVMRNTFIDVPIGRPLSLDEFYHERNTQSCPASGIVGMTELDDNDEVWRSMVTDMGDDSLVEAWATATAITKADGPSQPLPSASPSPPILRLADVLQEP